MKSPNPEELTAIMNVGADINVRSDYGRSVIISAATNPNPELIIIFINAGIAVNGVKL